MLLSNVKTFYELFGKENKIVNKPGTKHVLDRWVVGELFGVYSAATTCLDAYDTNGVCQVVLKFIDDLSTWYVRRSRDRFKSDDKVDQQDALQTLAYVLHQLSKVMAPVTPFIAEHVHQVFVQAKAKVASSVHLESWPVIDSDLCDQTLLCEMEDVRRTVSKALEEREKQKIPVRQPLQSVLLGKKSPFDEEIVAIIKDELNVKEVKYDHSSDKIVFDTKLTPSLLREGMVREFVRQVNGYRKELGLTLHDKVIMYVIATGEVLVALQAAQSDVAAAVQAKKIVFTVPQDEVLKEFTVQQQKVQVALIR